MRTIYNFLENMKADYHFFIGLWLFLLINTVAYIAIDKWVEPQKYVHEVTQIRQVNDAGALQVGDVVKYGKASLCVSSIQEQNINADIPLIINFRKTGECN